MKRIEKNVLYYPTIEIINTKWIRTALCIWDNVYRIVPPRYTPKDCDEVKYLIDQGLVHNIRLTDDDLKIAAEKYLKFMKKVPFVPAAAEKNDTDYINLHEEKLDVRIKQYFNILEEKNNKKGFLKISREQVNLYMLFLSETVANSRNMAKITDSRDMYTAIQYFQQKGLFSEAGIADSAFNEKLFALMLPIIMPKDIANIDLEKLLKIRNKSLDNRRSFRDSIENFAKNISSQKIYDEEYLKECMERFKNEQLAINSETKKMIISDIGDIAIDYLTTTIPVFLKNLISSQINTADNMLLTAIAGMPVMAKSVRKKWKSNTANYLVECGDSLNGVMDLKPYKYTSDLNEFIND